MLLASTLVRLALISRLARYALEGLPNKVLAREYKLALPDEKLLAREIERTRKVLEARRRLV